MTDCVGGAQCVTCLGSADRVPSTRLPGSAPGTASAGGITGLYSEMHEVPRHKTSAASLFADRCCWPACTPDVVRLCAAARAGGACRAGASACGVTGAAGIASDAAAGASWGSWVCYIALRAALRAAREAPLWPSIQMGLLELLRAVPGALLPPSYPHHARSHTAGSRHTSLCK